MKIGKRSKNRKSRENPIFVFLSYSPSWTYIRTYFLAGGLHWHSRRSEIYFLPKAALGKKKTVGSISGTFKVGADFREGDEDSNFSVFRVRRFTESSLNWISCRNPYQTHSLNCLPPFHWKTLFLLKSASSHPLPKKRHRLREGPQPGGTTLACHPGWRYGDTLRPACRHCTVTQLLHRVSSSLNKEGDVALAWRSRCHGTITDKHCT